jgi:Ferritin-like
MSDIVDSSKPFGNLFGRIMGAQSARSELSAAYAPDIGHGAYPDPNPRASLQQAAQLALQVEFTTIPPYLTALYSIVDPGSDAYQTLRSVVVEEMFHVNQAANLIVAIGGRPKFTGEAAPVYPCYLPHANPKRTPFIALSRASVEVFAGTFCGIETPAPPHAAPQPNQYDTIAQLYEVLRNGLERYVATHPDGPLLFDPSAGTRQRTDIYLGKFGGTPVLVRDIETAKFGIEQIMQQGEGSIPEAQPMIPDSRWGTYNYYGQRTDGTYGPILGTPFEMSHFRKFRKIALDVANFPATRPITSNPQRADFTNDTARNLAEMFDTAYSIMLDALEGSFAAPVSGKPDPFFALALPLMHQVMPKLARQLMTTPMHSEGDSSVGPNAAPTFLYRPGCQLSDLDQHRASTKKAVVAAQVTNRVRRDELVAVLDDVQNDIAELSEAVAQAAS